MRSALVPVGVVDVGGGLGSKLDIYAEEAICLALAKKLGRPVKWTASRSEDMQATIHGKPMVMVLLDSFGKYSRFADAARLRNWLDAGGGERLTAANTPSGGT